jgi:hypothetical protein
MVKKNVGPGGKKGKIKDLKLRKDTVKTLTKKAASSVKGGGRVDSIRPTCVTCVLD